MIEFSLSLSLSLSSPSYDVVTYGVRDLERREVGRRQQMEHLISTIHSDPGIVHAPQQQRLHLSRNMK